MSRCRHRLLVYSNVTSDRLGHASIVVAMTCTDGKAVQSGRVKGEFITIRRMLSHTINLR